MVESKKQRRAGKIRRLEKIVRIRELESAYLADLMIRIEVENKKLKSEIRQVHEAAEYQRAMERATQNENYGDLRDLRDLRDLKLDKYCF